MAEDEDSRSDQEIEAEMDRLYEQYVAPLEKDHKGAYVAVSPRGQCVLGAKLYDVVHDADQRFGPGNYIFKVGSVATVELR